MSIHSGCYKWNIICSQPRAMLEQDWGVQHYGYPATEWLRWANTSGAQALEMEIQNLLNDPNSALDILQEV